MSESKLNQLRWLNDAKDSNISRLNEDIARLNENNTSKDSLIESLKESNASKDTIINNLYKIIDNLEKELETPQEKELGMETTTLLDVDVEEKTRQEFKKMSRTQKLECNETASEKLKMNYGNHFFSVTVDGFKDEKMRYPANAYIRNEPTSLAFMYKFFNLDDGLENVSFDFNMYLKFSRVCFVTLRTYNYMQSVSDLYIFKVDHLGIYDYHGFYYDRKDHIDECINRFKKKYEGTCMAVEFNKICGKDDCSSVKVFGEFICSEHFQFIVHFYPWSPYDALASEFSYDDCGIVTIGQLYSLYHNKEKLSKSASAFIEYYFHYVWDGNFLNRKECQSEVKLSLNVSASKFKYLLLDVEDVEVNAFKDAKLFSHEDLFEMAITE
eukprot:Pgem_evm1s17526